MTTRGLAIGMTFVLFSCLSAMPVTAQPTPVLELRTGWSSDQAMSVLAGSYAFADTVRSPNVNGSIIRMVPVQLAGLDGILVLHVDSEGVLAQFSWSRKTGGAYARSETLNRYSGWEAWHVPRRDAFDSLAATLQAALGEGRRDRIVPVMLDPAEEPPLGFEVFYWQRDETPVELRLDDVMLEFRSSGRM